MIEKALSKTISMEHIHFALKTPGVYVVAIGTPSCLRTLYFRALKINSLSHLSFVSPSASDFATQKSVAVTEQHIHTLMQQTEEIAGIILYLSCLDIILNTDYDELVQNIKQRYNIPVKIFRRGPLEKRIKNPRETMEQILNELEIEMSPCSCKKKVSNFPLPPLSSDYSGISSLIYNLNAFCLLVSPGGCIHSIAETDESRALESTALFHTRFNDLELALGIEENIIRQMNSMETFLAKKSFVALLGTPTTYMTGASIEYIAETLTQKYSIPIIVIETNGFDNYRKGISKITQKLLENFILKKDVDQQTINILGLNALEFPLQETLIDLSEFFNSIGIKTNIPEAQGLNAYKNAGNAFFTLCVSDSAIEGAQYLSKKFSIPYESLFPVGISALIELMDKMMNIQQSLCTYKPFIQKYQELSTLKETTRKNLVSLDREVIFLGDHPVHRGLQYCLLQDYAIQSSIKELHLSTFDLSNKHAIYIGDPIFRYASVDQLVEIPYVALGGKEVKSQSFSVFGLQGNKFLTKQLKNGGYYEKNF